ncbi:hypothetical protein [Aquimarina mytili]|uniref:Uncharacterized protein n=1 Tax=Aquimarina mytili TaxID=874423 RepID=A0A936ZVI0_9FLAO|nr:hypothetical protein [Aquimarina mytili]MBL0682755.1 hypothetical protein [Aquimarina mytili]
MNQELQNQCINLSKEKDTDIAQMMDNLISENTWKFPYKISKLIHERETILYYNGDLEINEDLSLFKAKIDGLIIEGNLTINGTLQTYSYPETFLLVTGELTVDFLKNSGMLEVGRNLTSNRAIIGDYNHGFVSVHGAAKTHFFYPEQHFFSIHGAINFDYALGDSYGLNDNQNPEIFKINQMELDDVLTLFHEEVIQLIDPDFFELKNEEEVQDVEELLDFLEINDIIKRVEQNQPIFK